MNSVLPFTFKMMPLIISGIPRIQSYPAINHITNVDKVEAGLEEEAVNRIQSKKRLNTPSETEGSKRRQTGKDAVKATGEATGEATDSIMIPNSIISLGTMIKIAESQAAH
jgi:hypothetical protein